MAHSKNYKPELLINATTAFKLVPSLFVNTFFGCPFSAFAMV
jgi:hypothetical protein